MPVELATACLFLLENYDKAMPVGGRCGHLIAGLADPVARTVDFAGSARWDRSKPDGTPRKVLDVSRPTGLGWSAKIPLEEGVRTTYEWYLKGRAPHGGLTGYRRAVRLRTAVPGFAASPATRPALCPE